MPARYLSLRNLLVVCLVLTVFYFGKALFVPFFFALLISFILFPICKWLEKKKFSRSLAITASLVLAMLPIAAIVFILVKQLADISHNWNLISDRVSQLLLLLPGGEKISFGGDKNWITSNFLKDPGQALDRIVSSVSTAVQIIIIPFYVGLILYHRNRLVQFLLHLFPLEESKRILLILHETVTTYYNFVKGMLIVYLVVGILNSLGLLVLGIPNAFIYGFTASILTFIPYVGIIVGSVMPVTVAWSLHDNLWYPVGVVAIFTFVQFLEANFIFPLAVSYRIRINTLATLVAIFVGAIIWGASGMILFIPFAAILKLIAEKVEPLKPIAKLLDDDKATG